MFGYIDNNKEKIHKMVKDVLSPALGRPADELESFLLFGSVDDCIKKIKAFPEAGVNSIHFWPVNNYIEQIELFSKEIIYSFRYAVDRLRNRKAVQFQTKRALSIYLWRAYKSIQSYLDLNRN